MQLGIKLAVLAGVAVGGWYLIQQRQAGVVTDGASAAHAGLPVSLVGQAPFDLDRQTPDGEARLLLTQSGEGVPRANPAPTEVDESALRYFARQGDQRRLEAEIARLKALYPGWTPPSDPLAIPEATDTQLEAMWALYAQGRLAEARRRIVERQSSEPGWQPPQDLLDRLALAEARERLINASDLKQYETVIRVGSENPALLICAEMDVLWRVAEAFAMTERTSRAGDVYRYILGNCEDAGERVATMQKASTLLEPPLLDELLALEKRDADGTGEFEAIRDDLARNTVARGGEDVSLTVPQDRLARVERLAQEGAGPQDALLLGWYTLRRDQMEAAERWFRLARQRQDSGEASEGLALALIARGANAEAEEIAHPWRTDSEDRRKVYLAAAANLLGQEPRVPLSPEILGRIVAEAAAARDVATARQLGWYARDFRQHQTAGQWFSTALGWDANDEASAYGLALTRFVLRDTAGLRELKRQWAGRSQRIQDVGTERARDASGRMAEPCDCDSDGRARARPKAEAPAQERQVRRPPQQQQGTSRRSGASCRSYVNPATLSPQAALARGWCLMEINRPHEAAQAFDVALKSGREVDRRDASYGQSLAFLRAGLAGEAAVAATRAPQTAGRVVELQSAILAERALGSFEHGHYTDALIALDQRLQYAAERIDLMVLRGYAYLNLNRTGDALRVFEAVAATGNREGLRGIAAVRARQSFPN